MMEQKMSWRTEGLQEGADVRSVFSRFTAASLVVIQCICEKPSAANNPLTVPKKREV